LSKSAEIIKQQAGIFPSTISYPVGSYNDCVKAYSKKAGYKLGLAVNQDIYNSDKNDLFEIPRLELYNESFIKTIFRTNGTLVKIKKKLYR